MRRSNTVDSEQVDITNNFKLALATIKSDLGLLALNHFETAIKKGKKLKEEWPSSRSSTEFANFLNNFGCYICWFSIKLARVVKYWNIPN